MRSEFIGEPISQRISQAIGELISKLLIIKVQYWIGAAILKSNIKA